jgi:hypothetical protein
MPSFLENTAPPHKQSPRHTPRLGDGSGYDYGAMLNWFQTVGYQAPHISRRTACAWAPTSARSNFEPETPLDGGFKRSALCWVTCDACSIIA